MPASQACFTADRRLMQEKCLTTKPDNEIYKKIAWRRWVANPRSALYCKWHVLDVPRSAPKHHVTFLMCLSRSDLRMRTVPPKV